MREWYLFSSVVFVEVVSFVHWITIPVVPYGMYTFPPSLPFLSNYIFLLLKLHSRTVLHIGSQHPVNVTLQSIIERNFPEEYVARRKEVNEESEQDLDSMPLFLLGMVSLPNQPFPLHVFEPRYAPNPQNVASGILMIY